MVPSCLLKWNDPLMEKMMDLRELLYAYILEFNKNDQEIYPQYIRNSEAFEWMKNRIPLLQCPDKTIEKIYYFRWWTYRKHIKKTPEGFIITEFLPKVPWSGRYNSINCAAGFHIAEGRWLADADKYLEDYIRFWLKGSGDPHAYSTWLADSVWSYCSVRGDFSIGIELLPEMISNYKFREDHQLGPVGLYWSSDDRDCMEYMISGSGLRPTLNSYQFADAMAISRFSALSGEKDLQEEYLEKADSIKRCFQKYLWDGDFFKTIPLAENRPVVPELDFKKIPVGHNTREEMGFIPWYFNLPDEGYEIAFEQLKEEEGFAGRYGITTAEKRHPRYRFAVDHECLWNGPVWPFATSQTLGAVINLLNNYHQSVFTKEDFFRLLKQYAASQCLSNQNGRAVPWIDENLDPDTGEWLARSILKGKNWPESKGGYERGKDYNHSTFCDLVITGLLGIRTDGNKLHVSPLIPDDWNYFRLENLNFRGTSYTITYDKTGNFYHRGKGLSIVSNH